MDNQIIEWMKEIVNLHETRKTIGDDLTEEVQMWRQRFLSNLPKMKYAEKSLALCVLFCSISSRDMMAHTPEEHVEDIIRSLNYEMAK